MSPDFAARWFEIDPTYTVIRILGALGIIEVPNRPIQGTEADAAPAYRIDREFERAADAARIGATQPPSSA